MALALSTASFPTSTDSQPTPHLTLAPSTTTLATPHVHHDVYPHTVGLGCAQAGAAQQTLARDFFLHLALYHTVFAETVGHDKRLSAAVRIRRALSRWCDTLFTLVCPSPFDDPRLDATDPLKMTIRYINYFFTAAFIIEMLLTIVVLGFIHPKIKEMPAYSCARAGTSSTSASSSSRSSRS